MATKQNNKAGKAQSNAKAIAKANALDLLIESLGHVDKFDKDGRMVGKYAPEELKSWKVFLRAKGIDAAAELPVERKKALKDEHKALMPDLVKRCKLEGATLSVSKPRFTHRDQLGLPTRWTQTHVVGGELTNQQRRQWVARQQADLAAVDAHLASLPA